MSVMTNTDMNKVAGAQDTLSNDKPTKPLLVELRNGKLVFKQKALSFEKMSETMQEIVKFREMLEERLAAKEPPLRTIPNEHKPVFAKLVHESDKTLQALSKHIQHELLPAVDEDDDDNGNVAAMLPIDVVEDAVKCVAGRVNYGLDVQAEGCKAPAAWTIWRWEVPDEFWEWLPKAAREKADNRFKERQQLKRDVQTLFDSLPEEDRVSILGTKVGRPPGRIKSGTKGSPTPTVIDLSASQPPAPADLKAPSENEAPGTTHPDDKATDKKAVGRPKKPADPEKAAEKAAKEKERQEKAAAKAEREKKEKDAQAKSRSLMANFFGKAKPAAMGSPSKGKASAKDGENGSPGPATIQSDFQRTFRPFALKKDAEIAPENWFRDNRRLAKKRGANSTEGNVIIIDDEDDDEPEEAEPDVEMIDPQELNASPAARLGNILRRLSPGLNPPRRPRQPTGYKTYNPIVVRGLMSQLTEAEVAGDDSEVRRLLAVLRDRTALPAKALIFHEDARPGYFGTFTRNSREVGPRTPFAQDLVQVDYSYDSGEEWAEEEGEADDVVEDADEDGDGDDEPDSDMDSWLVDDDDVDEPGTPIEDRLGSPGFPDVDVLPSSSNKRKAKENEKEKEKDKGVNKRRRVVIPLVPFSKGPEWERMVGRCTYEPFNAYRIQLFNDTPFPIDPFTFVSEPVTQPSGSSHTSGQTPDGFVIPALPPHLAKTTHSSPLLSSSSSTITPSTPTPKRGVPPPKTAFPDAHLPYLVSRIEELATGSLLGIIEAVHRELQVHKVKKNAIEAKIREIGEKCKERKIWVVKPELRAQLGLP